MKCFKWFIWNSYVVWIPVSCFLSLFQCYFWTNWISVSMCWGYYAWRAIEFFFLFISTTERLSTHKLKSQIGILNLKIIDFYLILLIFISLYEIVTLFHSKKDFKVNWHFENTMCKSRPTFYQKTKLVLGFFVGERTTRFNLYKLLIGGLR